MPKFRSTIAWATTVVVAAGLLGACGSSSKSSASKGATNATTPTSQASGTSEAALLTAAEAEGQVMLYWEMGDPVGPNLLAAFNKKYPKVKASYFLGTSSVQIPKLDAERTQNLAGADLAFNSTTKYWDDRAAAGDLLPIGDLPNVAAWKQATGQDLSKNYATIAVSPFAILWNSQKVKPMTQLSDLLRPELKGKEGTLDMVSPAAVLYYSHVVDVLQAGPISKQGPWRLYATTAPMIQAVASGEILATAFASTASAKAAKDQGLPVDYAIPSDGGGTPNKGGVLKNARHPNAAKLMMNFILSPEGQAILVNGGTAISPMGAKLVPASPDLPKLTIVDPVNFSTADYQQRSLDYKKMFLGS